jgi:hypothetical protein
MPFAFFSNLLFRILRRYGSIKPVGIIFFQLATNYKIVHLL